MNPRIRQVLALMNTDSRGNLSLTQMADAASVTPAHFCRLFKAETGLSPARYLKRLRLAKARKLLTVSLLSVKEISVQVGFRDVSHFVRDFEEVYALSPHRYRQQQEHQKSLTNDNFR